MARKNLYEILQGVKDSGLGIADVQALQGEYDRRFVDKKGFTEFKKIRHTYAHLGKLLGRVAEYVEAMEEGKEVSANDIKTKVIPDLLVYSAWFANEFGVDMGKAFVQRFVGNLIRLHSNDIDAEELEALERKADELTKNSK